MRSIVFGVKVPGSKGGHTPWSDAQVLHGEKFARVDLSRVITLMSELGQRGSDTVRMKLTDIEEHRHPLTGRMIPGINVVTKKVGLRLWVPFTERLVEVVREWKRDIAPPWYLVTKQLERDTIHQGDPYTRKQLSVMWNSHRDTDPDLAPLKDAGLVLHGLRGTCVVRYRKSSATALEIGATIGMSPPMVETYCKFADRVDLAIAAVHRLSLGTSGERRMFANGLVDTSKDASN